MPYALYTSAEQAREWLESLAESDDPTLEFGFVRKSDGLLIGSGGIGPNEEGVWEVGYNLRRDCWGQGYASEAAREMIRFAHDSLGAREFGGNCAAANPASGRVLEKCGMRFDHAHAKRSAPEPGWSRGTAKAPQYRPCLFKEDGIV